MARVKLGKGFVSDSGVFSEFVIILLSFSVDVNGKIWIDGVLSKAGLVWFFAVLVSSFMLECRLIQLVVMKTDFIFIP